MNTRTFPIIMFLIVVFFLVIPSHDAHACSCVETTELHALEKSSASILPTGISLLKNPAATITIATPTIIEIKIGFIF